MVASSRNEKLVEMTKASLFTLDYSTPDWATWVGGMFSKIPSPEELGRMAIDAIF